MLLLVILVGLTCFARAGASEVSLVPRVRQILKGHTDWVHSVAFSPNGGRAVTGSLDGSVRIWNLANGQEQSRIAVGGKVLSVAISPDGRRLVSGGSNGLFVWDIDTLKRVAVLDGHKGAVTFVAFSKDRRFIASAGVDKTVRIWDAINLKQKGALIGHDEAVLSVSFSPDSTKLYSAGDRTVRVWLVPNGTTLGVWRGHESTVRWIGISGDGSTAASASYDGTVRVWDSTSGNAIMSLRPGGDVITAVEFLPDGRLLTAGRDSILRLWTRPYSVAGDALRGHTNAIESVAISDDGRAALTASWDKTIVLWDIGRKR